MAELDRIRASSGGCPAGSAVATAAGSLPAKFVFHAVGPIWHGGNHGEAELLASCYRTCLKLADERAVETISFPAISTGIYGYPMEEAARIAIAVVAEYLTEGTGSVREATFVLFDQKSYDIWMKQAP
jgi:O-acetyl-ADP-ribose deacetylase (regulator of RNase III)